MSFILLFLFLLAILNFNLALKTCIRKDIDAPEPSMVCVCNATYCDEIASYANLSQEEAMVYVSSISGKRFENTTMKFVDVGEVAPNLVTIVLDDSVRYQTMVGFGGALTERVAYYLYHLNLTRDLQLALLNAYYGQEGIGYTIGRVPMEGGDIDGYGETDDNVPGDFELKYFNLTNADYLLKIPLVKDVKNIVGEGLKLFATPWTAPAWMKASGSLDGGDVNSHIKGDIDGPYYRAWAEYYVKYFESYHNQGIDFWGLTVQNEPVSGILVEWKAMFMSAEMHRDFIKKLLGPALRNNPITKDIFLMIMDDQRWLLPFFADIVLNDPEAAKYVDGVAVHWYEDFLVPAKDTLGETHKRHPNVSLFASEGCVGYIGGLLNPPTMGDWNSAIAYASDMIDDFQNWVTGWMDWNIWNYGGSVSYLIVLNETSQEFYKNPSYYAMGHFSKFVQPNSIRVELSFDRKVDDNFLDGVCFLTPENRNVVVLQNRHMNTTYQVSIQDAAMNGKEIRLEVEPRSMVTIVWNKNS